MINRQSTPRLTRGSYLTGLYCGAVVHDERGPRRCAEPSWPEGNDWCRAHSSLTGADVAAANR